MKSFMLICLSWMLGAVAFADEVDRKKIEGARGKDGAARDRASGSSNHRELLEDTLRRIESSLARSKALRPEIERVRQEIEGLERGVRDEELDMEDALHSRKSLQGKLREKVVEAERELIVLQNDVEHGVLPRMRAVTASFKELLEVDGISSSRKERHMRLYRRAQENLAHLQSQLDALKANLGRVQHSRQALEELLSDAELEELVIDDAGRLADSLALLNAELGKLADLVDPRP